MAAVGLEPTTYGLPADTEIPYKSETFRFPLSAEIGGFVCICYQFATNSEKEKAMQTTIYQKLLDWNMAAVQITDCLLTIRDILRGIDRDESGKIAEQGIQTINLIRAEINHKILLSLVDSEMADAAECQRKLNALAERKDHAE
jgi:hypothetical protein